MSLQGPLPQMTQSQFNTTIYDYYVDQNDKCWKMWQFDSQIIIKKT